MDFGVDYYPEHWPREEWDADIAEMQELGVGHVRLAEFSWSLLEPEPGRYDFSFFDDVLDRFAKAGFGVILGTPTATVPPWLFRRHPDIHARRFGLNHPVGARRHASLFAPAFRDAAARLVGALAEHYGRHAAVRGWQIDNELGHEHSDLDFSDHARREFRAWLARRYGSVEKLNATYGTVFWSSRFGEFDEVPLPDRTPATGFNPALIHDFVRFQSEAVLHFVAEQSAILREHSPGRRVTTNLYGSVFQTGIDWLEIAARLDVVGWDFYPVWGSMHVPEPYENSALKHQWIRGLKNRPFWVLEQMSGFQGHTLLGYRPPPGRIRQWLYHTIAHGADASYFFRFRSARFGQEQLCFGIFDHDRERTARYHEIRAAIAELRTFADDLGPESPASVLLATHLESMRAWRIQPVAPALSVSVGADAYADVGIDRELERWHAGMKGLHPDGIHVRPLSVGLRLEDYRVVVLPFCSVLSLNEVERLAAYVRAGGHLVLGYRAGWKRPDLQMWPSAVPGPLRELAGLTVRDFDTLPGDSVRVRQGWRRFAAGRLREALLLEGARPLMHYVDGPPPFAGMPAVAQHTFGTGRVYYVGTSLGPKGQRQLFRQIFAGAGVATRRLPAGVERVLRGGRGALDYEFLFNHGLRARWLRGRRLGPLSVAVRAIPKAM